MAGRKRQAHPLSANLAIARIRTRESLPLLFFRARFGGSRGRSFGHPRRRRSHLVRSRRLLNWPALFFNPRRLNWRAGLFHPGRFRSARLFHLGWLLRRPARLFRSRRLLGGLRCSPTAGAALSFGRGWASRGGSTGTGFSPAMGLFTAAPVLSAPFGWPLGLAATGACDPCDMPAPSKTPGRGVAATAGSP